MVENEHIPILIYLYTLHKFVTLNTDVMCVNEMSFLAPLLIKTILFSAKHIPTHMAMKLSNHLNKIIILYEKYVLKVNKILKYMQFDKVADKVDSVEVNITAFREHMG